MEAPVIPVSQFELAGRLGKVFRLMPILIKLGVSWSELEENIGNENFWQIAATEAKIELPSLKTRELVVQHLKDHQRENGI